MEIASNLKYTTQCAVIIDGLATFLSDRIRGINGTDGEVKLHNWIMDNLWHQFMKQWVGRLSTSLEVGQSIMRVLK